MKNIIKSIIHHEPIDWGDLCIGIGYIWISIIAILGIFAGFFISKVL